MRFLVKNFPHIYPKVTVVTVCYNAINDLEKTIESTLSLKYENLEYIIVDGKSNDGTIDLLERTKFCGLKWISEPDSGIYDAMNKGISLSTGEWVIFMNAGDVFASENVVNEFMKEASSEYDFLYGDRFRVETNGVETLQQAGSLDDYLKTEVIYHQALFNRVSRLKYRNYNTNYTLAADYEYIVEAIAAGCGFKYVQLPVCKFQCGGRSRTDHVRGMTEAIKISIDYQPNKDLWTSSDFFKNYIGNHLETVIGDVIEQYLKNNKLGGRIFTDSNRNLRIDLNSEDETFKRYLNRILRPLSKLKLGSKPIPPSKNIFLPKVTVVTVVYNDLSGMQKTLANIMNLTYTNLEYIVIDGGSVDGTSEFLFNNKSLIDSLVSEKDDGIYYAMNKAIDIATGDYIIFMNAGDCFTKSDVIDRVFEIATSGTDIIYGDRNYISGESVTHQPAKDISTVFERMPYCHQSAFVKLSLIKLFKFETTYKFSADYNQIVKMYLSGVKFSYVDIIVSDFMAGGRSESGIRPYLEVVKIQLDNAPKDIDLSKSIYIKGLKNNFAKLIEEL